MKNICTAALLLLSGATLFSGQQQDLSKMKVNYLVGKISAEDAIKGFIAENKIKSFLILMMSWKNIGFRKQSVLMKAY